MQVAIMEPESDMVVKRLSVPMGLEELMESLTKEVLRTKPADIYAFASQHFAQLLEIRDQGNYKGSLKKTKKINTESSRDTLDNSHAKVNPVKVKSATFGAVTKVPKPINRPKSPAPKAFLTKKNSQASFGSKVSPRTFNNNNKNSRQDRTKMMIEKRRANKKNYEDTKKNLEVNRQPSELESKKMVEIPRETSKKNLEQRRQSLQHKRNDAKGEKEKLSSRNANKNKQDEIIAIGNERPRRKSETSKTLKKDIKKSSLKGIDELKALKMEGKASSKINPTTEKKNVRSKETCKDTISEASVISSNAEISDEVVTQMERQISEVEDSNLVSNTSKDEKIPEVKIEVSSGEISQEGLIKGVITSNDQILDAMNEDKSNSDSINIDSEDHDKISEGKIGLLIKNIDELEEGENSVLIGSVTEVKSVVDGVNENAKATMIKEEIFLGPCNDLIDNIGENAKGNDEALIVDEKSREIDDTENLILSKDVKITNAGDEKGHLISENKLYDDAAIKIQSLIRGYLARKMLRKKKLGVNNVDMEIVKSVSTPDIKSNQFELAEIINTDKLLADNKANVESATEKSEHVKDTMNKVNAIIKIQAIVRGYLIRKLNNTSKSPVKENIINVENKISKDEENCLLSTESTAIQIDVSKAASIIQALIRGFLVRRSLRKTIKDDIRSENGSKSSSKDTLVANDDNINHDKQESKSLENIGKNIIEEQTDEIIQKSNSKDIVQDVEVYKRMTTDFLGKEHINYDSERYDNSLRKLEEKSIDETKMDIVEKILNNTVDNELQKFDSKYAFGDDVKPRANSIEKIANVPNYGDEVTAKIQSDWQDHRMKRSIELRDLQKPPDCDELPHQRSSPDDAKKAATVIQALFRGYLVRKNYGNVDGLSPKKKGFEGKLPTVLEVEGEDGKDFGSNSSDDKKKESLNSASKTDDQVSAEETLASTDNSNHSSLQKSRTISDEEVYAILKQLDGAAIPTEEPRRKSKTYTRSLTFDDPSAQQIIINPLTKPVTCVVGDEFQRLDIVIDNAGESISIESTDGNHSIGDPTDISEITSSIKEDVQKLKQTLEADIDVHEVSDDKKEEDGNIADITKSIGEDVKQLEKALSQSTEIKPGESLTRPVSKDSVTSTDSVDTVIFNDIRKKELSTDNDLREDIVVNTNTVKLPSSNEINNERQNLMHLNAIKEQGDILVDDILDTAKNRLEDSQIGLEKNKFAEAGLFDQKSIDPLTSEKRQSTTSDELRQLWQDEAATTIQANYRGYRVRRQREVLKDIKSTEEKVKEEVTKYLNQITEPIRKAFSADKNNADGEEENEKDETDINSKNEKSPDVVYIPLRDYSYEERSTPLLEKPNVLDNIVSENRDVEGTADTIHQTNTSQHIDIYDGEVINENIKTTAETSKSLKHEIDLDVASNNEGSKYVDKDADEKISACISAIVEPITKKFQPNEEEPVEFKEETKMVVEMSKPEYRYIPLRDYSEEDKDTDQVVGLNDNITSSMSILKEDTEDSQVNLVEITKETNKNVVVVTKELVEKEDSAENDNKRDEHNLDHSTANIFEKSHAIVNPEKRELVQSHEPYESKEITEYINSLVEPVKQTFSPYKRTVQTVVQTTSKDKEPEYEYIPLRDYSTEGSTDETLTLPEPNTNSGDTTKGNQENKTVEIKTSSDDKNLISATENSFLDEAPQVVHESEVHKNKREAISPKHDDDKSNVSTNADNISNEDSNVDNEKGISKEKGKNISRIDTEDKKNNELQKEFLQLKEKENIMPETKLQSLAIENEVDKSKNDEVLSENMQLNNHLDVTINISSGDNNEVQQVVLTQDCQKLADESNEQKDSVNIIFEKEETTNGSRTLSPSNIEIKSDKMEEVVDTSEQFSDLVTEVEDIANGFRKIEGTEQQFDELTKAVSKDPNVEIDQNKSLENISTKRDNLKTEVKENKKFENLSNVQTGTIESDPGEAKKLMTEGDLNLRSEPREDKKSDSLYTVEAKTIQNDSEETKNHFSTEGDLNSENISFKTPVTENIIRVEIKDKDIQENISQAGQSNNTEGVKYNAEEDKMTEGKQTSINHKDEVDIDKNINIQLNFKNGPLEEVRSEATKEEFTDYEKHEPGIHVDGSMINIQLDDHNSQVLLNELDTKGKDHTVVVEANDNPEDGKETSLNTDKHEEKTDAITDNELQERIDNIESQIEQVFDKISSPSPNKLIQSDTNCNTNIDGSVQEQNNVFSDNKDEHDVDNPSLNVDSKQVDVMVGDDVSVEGINTTQEAFNVHNDEHIGNIPDALLSVNKTRTGNKEPVDEGHKGITVTNEMESNIATNNDSKLPKEHTNDVKEILVVLNDDDLSKGTTQVEDKAKEKEDCSTIINLDTAQTRSGDYSPQKSQSEENESRKQNNETKLSDINTEIVSSTDELHNTSETTITDQENAQSHTNGQLQDAGKLQSSHDVNSALTIATAEVKIDENNQTNFMMIPPHEKSHVKGIDLNGDSEMSNADTFDSETNTVNKIETVEGNVGSQVSDNDVGVDNHSLKVLEVANTKELEHDKMINISNDSAVPPQNKIATDTELENMRNTDEVQALPEKQSGLSMIHSKSKLGEDGYTKLVETEDTQTHDVKTIGTTGDSELSRLKTTSSESNIEFSNVSKTDILEKKGNHITDKTNGDENGENNLAEIDKNKKSQHDDDVGKDSDISNKEKIEHKSGIILNNIGKTIISGNEDKTDKESTVVSDKIQAFPEKESTLDIDDSKDKEIIDNDKQDIELQNAKAIGSSNEPETYSESNIALQNVSVDDGNMTGKGRSEDNDKADKREKDSNNEIPPEEAIDANAEVSNTEKVEAKSNVASDNVQKADEIQAIHEKESTLNIADFKDIDGANGQANLKKIEEQNEEQRVATAEPTNTQKTTIGEHESRIDIGGNEYNKEEIYQNKELQGDIDVMKKSEISGSEKIEVESNIQLDNIQKTDEIQEPHEKESILSVVDEKGGVNLMKMEDTDSKTHNEDSETTFVDVTDSKSSAEVGNTQKIAHVGKEDVGSDVIADRDISAENGRTSVMEVERNKELQHVNCGSEISQAEKVNLKSNAVSDNQVASGVVEESHTKEDVLNDVIHNKATEKIDKQEEHIKEEHARDEVAQNVRTYNPSITELSQQVIDSPGNESSPISNESGENKAISDDKIDKNKSENTSNISETQAVASTDTSYIRNLIENVITSQHDNRTNIIDNEGKEITSNVYQQNIEANEPSKDQSDKTTEENHDERVAEPLREKQQSTNLLYDKHSLGVIDETEQNEKDTLDQINAIDTNSNVEGNEKKNNEEQADNFVEPSESISNINVQDLSKKTELENEEVRDSESNLNSEELELNRELSPFYLHQDTFSQNTPSKLQEKKFSETFKHNLESDKYQSGEDTSEKLLHSSEFHDSLPIKVATESSIDKPQLTQTHGVQCNIGRERSMGTSTVLVHSGELHDNVLPLALQMNQDPGIEIVTSSNTNHTPDGGSGVVSDAQASAKDVSERLGSFGTTRAQSEPVDIPNSMDSEKRNNSTIVKKNMESEAATKIQAGFRGYQVRKQLKNKLARDNITNIKRTSRRRSLGRIIENKSQTKKPSDLEEQSATKIQAGIRGFLVRRRQKKSKPNNE